jgi:hypothetical protein
MGNIPSLEISKASLAEAIELVEIERNAFWQDGRLQIIAKK